MAEEAVTQEDGSPAPSGMVRFRGENHKILKTEKDSLTGAVYDFFEIKKTVKQGDKKRTVPIGHSLRRPGTGGKAPRMVPVVDEDAES